MIILREGKNSKTDIGIFRQSEIPKEINLIPYGKQVIKTIKPDIIISNNIISDYVAVTLYKQRNGKYKMKLKNTLVSFSNKKE